VAENLAGKTFEVQISEGGGQWSTVDIHSGRTPALQQAEALLDSGGHMGVRVISESERTGAETVFEKLLDGTDKAIQITPIDAAAVCETLEDIHGFEARRTVSRLMREYLDEHGFTALELAFDATQLMMLERDERLFPMAVQRVAGLQAKTTGEKSGDRVDWIYKTVSDLKEQARDVENASALSEVIADQGLEAAFNHVKMSLPEKQRLTALRFALARYLRGGGDWNAKLMLLTKLGAEDPGDAAREHLDEVLAEVLDGAAAVTELLGGQPDLGTANHTLIRLAVGRCPIPKNAISCIEAVNDVLARLDLPQTRAVLYDRIAQEIGGTRLLTREGRDRDRDVFVTLVRELVEVAGLEGGPEVAASVIRRARLVLGSDDDDLSLNESISRILDLLPHRAVRLGFLLDLAVSELGAENQTTVFGFVGRIVGQMTSITSFLPPGSSPEQLHDTITSLKKRLSSEGLPESWREGIAEALDSVANRGVDSKDAARSKSYEIDQETQRIIAMTPDRTAFAVGETLFEEGDPGDQAYLIQSGEVEIVHMVGNEERVLARLGRGEIFGEMSLIDNQPRMATARVSDDAKLAVITRENIESRLGRLARSDMVIRRLIDVFVTRIRGEARLHE
jgi:hypothetical protein